MLYKHVLVAVDLIEEQLPGGEVSQLVMFAILAERLLEVAVAQTGVRFTRAHGLEASAERPPEDASSQRGRGQAREVEHMLTHDGSLSMTRKLVGV